MSIVGTSALKLYHPSTTRGAVRRPIVFYKYHHKFLKAFHKSGRQGLTHQELAMKVRCGSTHATRSRWELEWMGYVEDAKITRRTLANHSAEVYRITPKGKKQIQLLSPSRKIRKGTPSKPVAKRKPRTKTSTKRKKVRR